MSKKLITACLALAAFAAFAVPAIASCTPYFRKTKGAGPTGFDDFTTGRDQMDDIAREIARELTHKTEVIEINEVMYVTYTRNAIGNDQPFSGQGGTRAGSSTREVTAPGAPINEVTFQRNHYRNEKYGRSHRSNPTNWTYETSELKACLA